MTTYGALSLAVCVMILHVDWSTVCVLLVTEMAVKTNWSTQLFEHRSLRVVR